MLVINRVGMLIYENTIMCSLIIAVGIDGFGKFGEKIIQKLTCT